MEIIKGNVLYSKKLEEKKKVLGGFLREGGQMMLYAPAGCHSKGTKVIMADGTFKKVEDIVVGDLLMGDDSSPREVLNLIRGREKMYRISPIKGESFIVNENHILSLYKSYGLKNEEDRFYNISVGELLKKSKTFRSKLKLYRTGFELPQKQISLDPYILGAMLGDGAIEKGQPSFYKAEGTLLDRVRQFALSIGCCVREEKQTGCIGLFFSRKDRKSTKKNPFIEQLKRAGIRGMKSGDKSVPALYKYNSKKIRAQVLAGLLDTDGSLDSSKTHFDFISKSEKLAKDVEYIARSLGLFANFKQCTKGCQNNFKGIYYRVGISGEIDIIPTIQKKGRERKQIKNPLVTGFKIEALKIGKYFGFQINKNHLYLTSDFFVHHNCGKSMLSLKLAHDLSTGKPFLGYPTKKSKVLYIDAEMNENQIQSRMKGFYLGGTEMDGDNLDLIVCPKDRKESFAISDPEVQRNFWKNILVRDNKKIYDVVIFDNLYTLTYQNGNKDTEFDVWERVERLLKALEKYNICGIWIHHANKMGTQQGTVNKEKIMNCIMRLEKGHLFEDVPDSSQVVVSFDKVRDDTWQPPVYVRFKRENKDTVDELIKFSYSSLKQARVDHVRGLLRVNPNLTVKTIQETLGVPLAEASALKEIAESPNCNDPDADPMASIQRFQQRDIFGEKEEEFPF